MRRLAFNMTNSGEDAHRYVALIIYLAISIMDERTYIFTIKQPPQLDVFIRRFDRAFEEYPCILTLD